MSRIRPIKTITTCVVALLLVIGANARAQRPPSDAEAVENFLSRLGLIDLQILHLEQSLDATSGQGSRIKLAKHLADLYAERLMNSADDAQRSEEIRAQVERLLSKVPEANTPGLNVMLLQADYGRAEKLFNKWLDDPSETAAFEEAKRTFIRIAPELAKYDRQLSVDLKKIQEEMDKIEDERALVVKEKEARRIGGFANRAAYFAGWSNYYFGLTKRDADQAQPEFRAARDGFRKILGISDDESYEELEIEWLGLENINRATALVGLGLTEAALGDLKKSRKCFDFLDHVSAPPSLRDHAPFWFLRGMLNMGLIDDAVRFAEDQVKKFAGGATQGKIAFCVAMIRTGFAVIGASTADHAQLGKLGVQGLARLGQIGAVRHLMSKQNLKVPTDTGGFYLTWLNGQQQVAKADFTKKADDYKAAAETLEAALAEPEAQTDLLSSGQCRYELGWCYFNSKQFEKAGKHLRDAAAALKTGARAKAADAAWLGFYSYYELSKKESRFVGAAIDALKSYRNDFPDSANAKKADYYLGRLEKKVSAEDSIASLSKVTSGDDNYLATKAELCSLYHQQWSKVRADADKAASAATDVYTSVDQFLTAARRDSDNARKLKSILYGIDVAMRSKTIDLGKAESYLAAAKPFVESVSPTSSSVAQYHYHQFRVAKSRDNNTALNYHANWITENAKGSIYEKSAIITVANQADAEVKSATGTQRRQAIDNALNVYRRLVELSGDSQEKIKSDSQTRIVNSRLAQYEAETGDHASAARRLEKIVAAYPSSRTYLRRAGLAQYRAGNYSAALPHWRKLADGLVKNTPDWFEAKYHQISSLASSDRNKAKGAMKQFKLLYPLDKIDTWGEKFKALDRDLSR